MSGQFTMYSTPWCGYCHRLKGQMDREGISFSVVDIEQDPSAADLVMAANGGGSIVHISSIAGFAADGDEGAYNASKAGMRGLNNTMARELAQHGIRSNLIAPGYTATPLTRDFLGSKTFDYVMDDFDRIPERRMATSEEIAASRTRSIRR